ncbi:MAG: putative bifunctional diguanylate cyclase/phosphodiesterase [Hyphomicrobium sp.]
MHLPDRPDDTVADRLAFADVDAQMCRILHENSAFIMGELPSILNDFYDHMSRFPPAASFFRDRAHMDHARDMQLKHWRIISEGLFDEAYRDSVRKIGQTHNRLGLEPSIYIGGYSFLLSRLIVAVQRRPALPGSPFHEGRAALQAALIKAAMLDMDIAISVYFGIERRERQKAMVDEILFSKYYDTLTGLPNRNGVEALLAAMPTSDAPRDGWTVMTIDIDRFHQINDMFGVAMGDAVLKDIGAHIQSQIRPNDMLARISGDEFAIIAPTVDTADDVAERASHILLELAKPTVYLGHTLRVGASVGIAFEKAGAADFETTLNRANTALQSAKKRGRGSVSIYSRALHDQMDEHSQLSADIARGIDCGEFLPYFQPKFRASGLSISGAEVLLRWHHPTKGVLNPGSFLAVAGEMNYVDTLDDIALAHAETQYNIWLQRGIAPQSISVNASLSRLANPEFVNRLISARFPKSVLTIELLESAFMDEAGDAAMQALEALRARHINWEIDDFGTGHASILGLIRLKPAGAKIDRQFVPRADAPPEDYQILTSMITIASSLGMKVTVEGVEDTDQIATIRRLGCDTLQGFALARPMEADAFAALLMRERNGASLNVH